MTHIISVPALSLRLVAQGSDAAPAGAKLDREVDSVLLASRVLVAVVAASLAQVEEVVSLPQLRVLVMVSSRGPLNVGAVAAGLGVHRSNATRACDWLVAQGLLDRRELPTDRR